MTETATVMKLGTTAWRHKMQIKDFINNDETTVEIVDAACNYVIAELDKMLERERRWQDSDPEDRKWYLNKIGDLKGDFDVLIGSDDMSTDDLENEFNLRLEELYDLGDSRIKLKNGTMQKFLWVGAV